MKRFVTIGSWAKLAGIQRESVYKRLKSGRIKISDICEHPLIDIEEYPPCRYKSVKCSVLMPVIKHDLPDWCYD